MTGHAGEAIGIETRAVYLGVGSQRAGKHADGIVTTVAVAGEGDAAFLVADEDVDAGAVERRAEGIGVQGLPPLMVGLLVTDAAILSGGISTGLQEALTRHLDVAGNEGIFGAVVIVVGRRNLAVLRFAIGLVARACVGEQSLDCRGLRGRIDGGRRARRLLLVGRQRRVLRLLLREGNASRAGDSYDDSNDNGACFHFAFFLRARSAAMES